MRIELLQHLFLFIILELLCRLKRAAHNNWLVDGPLGGLVGQMKTVFSANKLLFKKTKKK